MRQFFNGWRRKVGCIAIAMACVFIAMWMRAIYSVEELLFRDYKEATAIVSSPEGIRVEKRYYFDGYAPGSGDAVNRIVTIPHVTLVGVPILLSACLFLWKPRKRE